MDWRSFFKPKTPQTSQKPSAIPMLDQVMSVTKGASNPFSGVSNNVNATLKKFTPSGIQATIVYGLGFGHGFGVGISMRSGVLDQIQSGVRGTMTNMMMKFGLTRSSPSSQGALPAPSKSAKSKATADQISAESKMQLATKSAEQDYAGSMMQMAKSINQISQGLAGSQPVQTDSVFENKAFKGNSIDSASVSQNEKAISNLPQKLELKGEGRGLEEPGGRMQSQNKILQTVLKQKQIIEELVEENEKLRQILVEDPKTPSSKPQGSSADSNPKTFPPPEVQDKFTGGSMPHGDAQGTPTNPNPQGSMSKTSIIPALKGESDGNKD